MIYDPLVLQFAVGFWLLAVLTIGGAIILYLAGHTDWANTPAEFGVKCKCGHDFQAHRSEPRGVGSPCRAGLCPCASFEPECAGRPE